MLSLSAARLPKRRKTRHAEPECPPMLDARCPTCGQPSHFHHAGEQHWPEAVAKAAGMPTIVQLWTCAKCLTTLTDLELE